MTDRMQSSPGPGDETSMESPSRSAEMSMFSRSHDLAGMPEMGVGLLPSSFASDRELLNSYGPVRNLPSDPLAQWYERNDGPWIPKDIAPPQNGEHSSSRMQDVSVRGHGLVFAGSYREGISPSECDTVPPGIMPSDSGYASNGAKQSIATASVYEDILDRSQETQSLAGQFSDFHFQGFAGDVPRPWTQQQSQPLLLQRPRQLGGKELVCETCRKTLKTNSELKKHRHRHTKPYACDVPGCSRIEGFSTTNDLDRHKRSVHPDKSATGNRYRCPHGACRNKEKIWPRADNFRAHVKRVHQQKILDDELEHYIHRRPVAPLNGPRDVLPDIVGLQTSTGEFDFQFSSNMDPNFIPGYWHPEPYHNAVIDLSQNAPTEGDLRQPQAGPIQGAVRRTAAAAECGDQTRRDQSENEQQAPSSEVSDVAFHLDSSSERVRCVPKHSPSLVSGQREEDLCSPQYVTPETLSQHAGSTLHTPEAVVKSSNDIVQSLISPTGSHHLPQGPSPVNGNSEPGHHCEEHDDGKTPDTLEITGSTAADVSSLVKDPEKIRQILEALQSNGLLKELGYKKEASPTSENKETESVHSQHHENHNSCPTCHKKFGRRCELKKHMKRHEKPYGCTFQGCNKRFGSKNDWKRHENSQHFLLEVWRCDVKRSDKPADTCGKVSHRRETFKQHLANSHHLTSNNVEKKLEECRVGRNCEARFWCGFCQEIIEIKQKGLNAWTERFNHIDDHFAGRNEMPRKQIDDWKNVDPEAPRVVEVSGSDSENGGSPPPSIPSISISIATGSGTNREITRSSGPKRRTDDADDVHQSKRTKSRAQAPVTICCIPDHANELPTTARETWSSDPQASKRFEWSSAAAPSAVCKYNNLYLATSKVAV
ncbi:hypothetical protein BJ170DRAFT_591402 [Xylariales sp. AK1849]|nr:hypothetical protein BJ170DRAFT_591402 [Xylariales sp. AK1849]